MLWVYEVRLGLGSEYASVSGSAAGSLEFAGLGLEGSKRNWAA